MIDDTQLNLPEVLAEVEAAYERYERALVGNDVAVLDELFWNHPMTLRFGATENLWSYGEIAEFRASRPSQGLQRRILKQVTQTFGRDFATVSVQFEREGRPGWVGRQQQTWVRTAAGWRVVAAHVSFMGLPAS
ncbi:MAG: oxalurate catabolism protein HpxZ [Burkholderiales bacterium]|nr:MAG: oxalurate catabolism protein HpxZ [Burkholderiales bacterium]